MTRRLVALPAAVCLAVLLPTACTSTPPAPTPPPPRPTPTPDTARADVIAALQRSQAATIRYVVRGNLPEGQYVTCTGALAPTTRRLQTATAITGGKFPSTGNRIVIGTDEYLRDSAKDDWIHLDLKRVKPDNPLLHFDWTDPTGLKRFTAAILSAEQIDPHTYSGKFNPEGKAADPFIPVGAPSIVTLGMLSASYTITTNAQGWVTSIKVQLAPTKGPKLTLTTTLTAHGSALNITAPAGAKEAADFYYD